MSARIAATCAFCALVFGAPTAAQAQMSGSVTNTAAIANMPPVDDERVFYHAVFDELEGRFGRDSSFRWEGEAWAGTDTNRLWLKSEGEITNGTIEDGQQEVLYDRPITSYFDLQAGARYDLDSKPGRGWAAFGVEGLAPQFFHVAATAYASDTGHYGAKFEGSYDQLLTQRLILEPRIEINLYAKSDPARLVGSGLSDIDAGLRLRYEIGRKFAPYVGVTYEAKFGQTASFAHAVGEHPDALRLTVGVRAWL